MSTPSWIASQFGPNSGYIEELYNLYRIDRSLVGETWASFFDQALPGENVEATRATNGHTALPAPEISPQQLDLSVSLKLGELQARVYRLVSAYRSRAHLAAKINPLTRGISPLPVPEDIPISFYNFSPDELAQEVICSGFAGRERMVLSDLVQELSRVYCGSIGFEFTHLLNQEERIWLQNRIEQRFNADTAPSADKKLRWIQRMIDAEVLEAEFNKRYPGQTRFSIEGGETLFAVLDQFIESCLDHGVKEVVAGMSHRARVNVLVNTLGKPLEELLTEFEDRTLFTMAGSGDVKYHMGYSSVVRGRDGQELLISLAPNPSHLEFVDPVVEGMSRARQDMEYAGNSAALVPLLMHGDASFIGQGIVFETLNFSGVPGYNTGGTVHIVINNQVGFTTDPRDSRSSTYCTEFAKAVQAPIIHVNGEDVEASCWAISLACDFRMRYARDVVLDLYGYRKHGHNEGDDPTFTQPITYAEIKEKNSVAQSYAAKLAEEGVVSKEEVDAYRQTVHERINECHERSKSIVFGESSSLYGKLCDPAPAPTAVSKESLLDIATLFEKFPSNFAPHPKLQKILEKRVQSVRDGDSIEWGFAEVLALGTLVSQGINVRLSGQDAGRGTFSQRHVLLSDYNSAERYSPLDRLPVGKGSFTVVNSTLSEAGVLGFEFGYGATALSSLVLWEAQFGDFANGAQVIIDQFICSSEVKWNQRSGVVLLLPHGSEGRGPEHSSARLERFLQLCSHGNMSVCYPSTAAQYFHLLRRQGLTSIKRPLIIMTPKSLLRLASAAAPLTELTDGAFNPVIFEQLGEGARVGAAFVLSGKIYHDLLPELSKVSLKDKARLVRLEEYYPFPAAELKEALDGVPNDKVFWVQEEPHNAGAWSYVESKFRSELDICLNYIGRPESPSPASGSAKRHAVEQKQILDSVIARLSR